MVTMMGIDLSQAQFAVELVAAIAVVVVVAVTSVQDTLAMLM